MSALLSHFILRQLHLNALDVGPCSPSLASSDTSTPELQGLPSQQASWNLAIASPQFRPPSFQGKAFFRQALAKRSSNFRGKITLYISCKMKFTNRLNYIDSHNGQGPDIMGRTEVNVFLVAMAILPFLQNMLLNIGTGHNIHVRMYTKSFAKTLAIKNIL